MNTINISQNLHFYYLLQAQHYEWGLPTAQLLAVHCSAYFLVFRQCSLSWEGYDDAMLFIRWIFTDHGLRILYVRTAQRLRLFIRCSMLFFQCATLVVRFAILILQCAILRCARICSVFMLLIRCAVLTVKCVRLFDRCSMVWFDVNISHSSSEYCVQGDSWAFDIKNFVLLKYFPSN